MWRPDTAYIEAQTARCLEGMPKERFVEPFWTEEKDTRLIALTTTHTCIAAAREMHISRKAMNGRAKALGFKFQPRSNTTEPSFEEWRTVALEAATEAGVCHMAVIRGDRNKAVCWARWRAWKKLMAMDDSYSLAGVGRVSGWDHTSVRFGLLRLNMSALEIRNQKRSRSLL